MNPRLSDSVSTFNAKSCRSSAFVWFSALGACMLSACFESPEDLDSNGLEPLKTERYFIGDYSLLGQSLAMKLPPDTIWNCMGASPILEIDEPEIDTTRYEISGNSLRLFSRLDTLYANDNEGGEVIAVVQRHSQFARAGSGSGLEGRWQWDENGYTVLFGALDKNSKAVYEHGNKFMLIQLRYIKIELQFSQGKAWGRGQGNYAGLFLALWNGELQWDSLDTPDSARYDVQVTSIAQDAVQLKGNKSGETVTISLKYPSGFAYHYTSDNPERIPYSDEDARRNCNVDTWFDAFKSENSKAGEILKKTPLKSNGGRLAPPAIPPSWSAGYARSTDQPS